MDAYYLLRWLPKNWLSWFVGFLADRRLPLGLHANLKTWFVNRYSVDMSEAEHSLAAYETLGDLFKRRLKPGCRPLGEGPLLTPVDGILQNSGPLSGRDPILPQVKGRYYKLSALLGEQWELDDFSKGAFCTIYLAPGNYHRIHSPLGGQVIRVHHIPGALWPVNNWSVSHIDGLFAVNERMIVEIGTSEGRLLLVMVGATNVGKITLSFNKELRGNARVGKSATSLIPAVPITVERGEPLGCFELGSTVILVLDSRLCRYCNRGNAVETATPLRTVKMGEWLRL